MPADPRHHREVANLVDEEPWVPSVEHTLTHCPACDRLCWIGPEQRKLLKASSLIGCRPLCALCCLSENGAIEFSHKHIALNPTEHQVPRRLT